MAVNDATVEALRARLGRTVASLLADGGAGGSVVRRATVGGHEVAAPRRRSVSDERLLWALVKEIARLMAEEGRRGVGSR